MLWPEQEADVWRGNQWALQSVGCRFSHLGEHEETILGTESFCGQFLFWWFGSFMDVRTRAALVITEFCLQTTKFWQASQEGSRATVFPRDESNKFLSQCPLLAYRPVSPDHSDSKGLHRYVMRLHPCVLTRESYNKSGTWGVKSHSFSMKSKHCLETKRALSTEAASRSAWCPHCSHLLPWLSGSLALQCVGRTGKMLSEGFLCC